VGRSFLEIEDKKEAQFDALPRAVVCVLHAAVAIPMAAKNFSGFAALQCLLRVTADDIRQRYSAPVSGIVAPQRVSNVRIVTKL
jgi:hypothetical protein